MTDESKGVDDTGAVDTGAAGRMQAMGCMVAFFGMVLLTVTPAIGRYVEFDGRAAMVVLALAVVLLGVGAGIGLLGASRGR